MTTLAARLNFPRDATFMMHNYGDLEVYDKLKKLSNCGIWSTAPDVGSHSLFIGVRVWLIGELSALMEGVRVTVGRTRGGKTGGKL